MFWGRLCATGGASGLTLETDLVWVVEMLESKVVALRVYDNREEALEAAGLSE